MNKRVHLAILMLVVSGWLVAAPQTTKPAAAKSAAPKVEFEKYVLPNGLNAST